MAIVHEIVYYIECDACQKRGPETRDKFCDIEAVTKAAGFHHNSFNEWWHCSDCYDLDTNEDAE